MHYYADLATKVRGAYQDLPSTLGRSYGMVVKRPVGPVAAIVPYNFPLTLMGTKIGPALAAGNTVVVKPASSTPLATLKVAELFHEAGLPAGVLNVVTGRGSVIGDALVTHPLIRRVAFTGETGTGRHIAALAAPDFKRITLELEVRPDDRMSGREPSGCRERGGDRPLLERRSVVPRGEAAVRVRRGLRRLRRRPHGRARALRMRRGLDAPGEAEAPHGAGPHGGTRRVGRTARGRRPRGATVLHGGGAPSDRAKGFYFEPTLVENAPHDSRLVTEEVFGPILPIFRVHDLDEAIRLANDTRYGLGSSIWTYDARNIDRRRRRSRRG